MPPSGYDGLCGPLDLDKVGLHVHVGFDLPIAMAFQYQPAQKEVRRCPHYVLFGDVALRNSAIV